MKVCDHFKAANGETLISFEILPPLKGGKIQSIFDTLDPLMEFNPPFKSLWNRCRSPFDLWWILGRRNRRRTN